MRTSLMAALLPMMLCASHAWSHDTTPSCGSAGAKQPSIDGARTELKHKPNSLSLRMRLADKLIDVGCYDEAVYVLEDGAMLYPADRDLQSRLKTARSFIGEREYLGKQPAANDGSEAAFLRAQLRCVQFGDLTACEQALANKPNDIALWVAKGDALLKEKRSRDAMLAFTRARQVNEAVDQVPEVDLISRINAAQALLAVQNPPSIAPLKSVLNRGSAPTQTPPPTTNIAPGSTQRFARAYSNLDPAGRSH